MMQSLHKLTKQELVVLSLVAKGWTNARIAHELVITVRTVEAHMTNIFTKLDVNSRTQAAMCWLTSERAAISEMSRSHDDSLTGKPYPSA